MRDQALDALLGAPEEKEAPFDSLMPRRVNNLLLVTSLYDCYTFIEDGRLSEMLFSEYIELNLRFAPSIERVSTAQEALDRLRAESFDLVISMPRVGEMNVRDFGRAVKEIAPALPVVVLAANPRELLLLQPLSTLKSIDRVFVWLGDARLFLAIIKLIEDQLNALHDAETAGVKSILLLEDSVQFYSSYLPMLYTELMRQTQALMADGVNRMQKLMRMRARPKILLGATYEEGLTLYERHQDHLLGVILDAFLPRSGAMDRLAGASFARIVKERTPGLPVVIQSGSANAALAETLGVEFLDKNSPSLLNDLRRFLQGPLGFGEFTFRLPDGSVVSRVSDLRHLEWAIQAVPDESLAFHARCNDLNTWLRARTEFQLAESVRDIMMEERERPAAMRGRLLKVLAAHRAQTRAGVVVEFSPGSFEGKAGFVRIGSGSLGGKGRGLAFIDSLMHTYQIADRIPGIRIFIPQTAVLTTSVFDSFMESSGLMSMALSETDDEKITRAFLAADLADDVVDSLWNFLDWVRYPLAVRSSSLLEDASVQPFAGIYDTYMIPNNHPDPEVRLEQLCRAIKMVYASTYHADAKAYLESTPHRLEEEKMAVVIQRLVGQVHEDFLYPHVAGVARALNFYPMPGMRPEDGVASVVLGLGKMVVDGGRCFRFSPAHPKKPMQSFTPKDHLENSQREFYALDLRAHDLGQGEALRRGNLQTLDLQAARQHGTLAPVASVYSPDNNAIYDGLSRPGIPLVTMAGVLKGHAFPLAETLSLLLKVGAAGSSCPVEIEFACNLSGRPDEPHEFGFLQIRPLVLGSDAQDVQLEDIRPADALAIAHQALGNGFLTEICDLVYVRPKRFERSRTPAIAEEVGRLNAGLRREQRPFLLIGPGRWGSTDPWLGIPVKWAQISGVRCIVETDLDDFHVDPSQGSHFFHNIMSFGIGYLTVHPGRDDMLDLNWLEAQPAERELEYVRHLHFSEPLDIALNGRRSFGVIMKSGQRIRARPE